LTRIVVDASITGLILLSDEADWGGEAILDCLLTADLILAAHWQLEVASLLVKATRRQRLPVSERLRCFAEVDLLLAAGNVAGAAHSREIFDLAKAANLTAYDAVYLDLAIRLDATLATNDDALIAAARARGLPVLTTRT